MQCLRVFCNQCKQNILDDNALLRQLMPLPQLRYHRMNKFLKKINLSIFKKNHFQHRFYDSYYEKKSFSNIDFQLLPMWIYMAQFEMRKLPNNLLLLENHSFEIFYTFYYCLLCLLKIITDFAIQLPSSPIQIPSHKRLINQRLRSPPTVG